MGILALLKGLICSSWMLVFKSTFFRITLFPCDYRIGSLLHLFASSFCVISFVQHFITTILPRIYVSISRVWDDSSWALFLKAVGTDLYRFICWESPFCPINIVSRKITYSTQQYCHVEFLFTSFNKIVKPQRFSEKY
jgi:hypothetical protein